MRSEDADLEEVFTEVSLGFIRTLEQGPSGSEQVVLIHGFGGDAENWRFNLNALARRRRVIAVDLPGHGESTKSVGAGDSSALVDAVDEVLKARQVRRAHLVGHSLGGLVAARLALQDPYRCVSLALIAPAGLGQILNSGYVEGFVNADTEDDMHQVLEMLFANRGLVNAAFARQVLRDKLRADRQTALKTVAEQLLATNKQPPVNLGRLKSSGIRTMALWGTEDQVLSCPTSSTLHDLIQMVVLDGVGHSPHIEAPRDVNRALTGFFKEASALEA